MSTHEAIWIAFGSSALSPGAHVEGSVSSLFLTVGSHHDETNLSFLFFNKQLYAVDGGRLIHVLAKAAERLSS